MITVCDNAREACPFGPDNIYRLLGSPDPALAEGDDEKVYRTFQQVALQIQRRIDLFTSLPFDKLTRLKLASLTSDIGNK